MTDLMYAQPGDLGGPVLNGMELRDALGATVEDLDDAKHEVLAIFPHHVVDTYKTTFGPETFEDCFAKRMPNMCWQHDLRDPIGVAIRAQSTTRGNELRGKFGTFDAVPNARRAFAQLRDGTLTDFSFGFRGARYGAKDKEGVRHVRSAFMVEFSPVSIGSIPGAQKADLREGTGLVVADLTEIMWMRDHNMMDDAQVRAWMEENRPDLATKLTVRTGADTDAPGGATGGSGGSGADDSMEDDETQAAPIKWTAVTSGLHTAVGPNNETLMVKPVDDDQRASGTKHSWHVIDAKGKMMGHGVEDNRTKAKAAAVAKCMGDSGTRSLDDYLSAEGYVTAESVLMLVRDACPDMYEVINGTVLSLRQIDDEDGVRSMNSDAVTLVQQLDAALDAAASWIDSVDTRSLPPELHQFIALVGSAGTTTDALMDLLGIEDAGDDFRAATTFSDKDWDGDASNYTPQQYKDAALIDTGEGDPTSKDRYALPVKDPDGTYNKKGIAAAASRLNQVDAGDEEKQQAARSLMSLYKQMGSQCPPNVLKIAGAGKRSDMDDPEVRADMRSEAMALLEGHAAKLPAPV